MAKENVVVLPEGSLTNLGQVKKQFLPKVLECKHALIRILQIRNMQPKSVIYIPILLLTRNKWVVCHKKVPCFIISYLTEQNFITEKLKAWCVEGLVCNLLSLIIMLKQVWSRSIRVRERTCLIILQHTKDDFRWFGEGQNKSVMIRSSHTFIHVVQLKQLFQTVQ